MSAVAETATTRFNFRVTRTSSSKPLHQSIMDDTTGLTSGSGGGKRVMLVRLVSCRLVYVLSRESHERIIQKMVQERM